MQRIGASVTASGSSFLPWFIGSLLEGSWLTGTGSVLRLLGRVASACSIHEHTVWAYGSGMGGGYAPASVPVDSE